MTNVTFKMDLMYNVNQKTLNATGAALNKTATGMGNVGAAAKKASGSFSSLGINTMDFNAKLKKLNYGFVDVDSMLKDKIPKSSKKSTNSMNRLMNSFTKFRVGLVSFMLVAAMVKRGFDAVNESLDIENTMNKVASITGQTFESVKSDIMSFKDDTIFSLKEVTDAYMDLSKKGFNTTQISEMMGDIQDLATSGFTDLTTAGDMTTQIMRQFNLTTADSERIVSSLSKATDMSASDVKSMGQGLAYVGAVANIAGFELEEVEATLGMLSNAGLSGTKSALYFRQAITSLVDPSEEAKTKLKALGIEIYDSEGKLKDMDTVIKEFTVSMGDDADVATQLAEIFNTRAMTAIATLVKEYTDGTTTIKGFSSALDDVGYAARVSAEIQTSSFLTLKQELTDLKTKFYETETAIGGMAATTAKGFGRISDYIDATTRKMTKFNVALATGKLFSGNIVGAIGQITPEGGMLDAIDTEQLEKQKDRVRDMMSSDSFSDIFSSEDRAGLESQLAEAGGNADVRAIAKVITERLNLIKEIGTEIEQLYSNIKDKPISEMSEMEQEIFGYMSKIKDLKAQSVKTGDASLMKEASMLEAGMNARISTQSGVYEGMDLSKVKENFEFMNQGYKDAETSATRLRQVNDQIVELLDEQGQFGQVISDSQKNRVNELQQQRSSLQEIYAEQGAMTKDEALELVKIDTELENIRDNLVEQNAGLKEINAQLEKQFDYTMKINDLWEQTVGGVDKYDKKLISITQKYRDMVIEAEDLGVNTDKIFDIAAMEIWTNQLSEAEESLANLADLKYPGFNEMAGNLLEMELALLKQEKGLLDLEKQAEDTDDTLGGMTDSYKAWVEGIRIAVGALVSEARDSNKDISRLTREFMDQAQGINEFKRESSEESMTEEEKDFEKKKKLYELERREHELTQDIFGMEIKKVIGFNEDEARSLDEVTSAVGREKSKISELKSNMDDLEENIENIIGWNSDEVLSYDELTAAIDRTTEAIRKKNAAEEKKKYKKDKDRMSADTSEAELTAGWAGAFDSQRPSSDEGSSYSTTGMSYDDQATSSKIVGTYEQDAMTKDLLEKWGVTGAADGGIFQHPTLRMIGESGPEAVVPLNQVSGMGGVTFGNIQIVGSNMSASEVEIKFAQVIKRELASLGR